MKAFSSITLSVLMLTISMGCLSLPVMADGPSSSLAWEDICYADVCRATGHDGVRKAKIAPTGDRIVMHVHGKDETGLFLISSNEGEAEFLVEGASPYWFEAGNAIVYVADNNLWMIDTEKKVPVQLTDDEHDVRNPRPSPDGSQIAFYSSRSGYQDIWLVEADGSADVRQLTNASMALEETRFVHAWSPDGDQIAYFSSASDYWHDDLWLVEVESGQANQLSSGFMGRAEPSWSPDGSLIAAYGTAKEDFWYGDLVDLFIVDLETGEDYPLSMDRYAMDIDRPVWSGDGSGLFFPRHERGEVELWRVPLAGGVATRVTNMGGMIHAYDATPEADQFLFVRSTSMRGREADLLDELGGKPEQVGRFATDWPGLVEPEEISYRSWDGQYIQAFMFKPSGFDPTGDYPVLVQVHGGGTNSYYNGLNLVEQRLAQRGYVVLAINYRGGSGFGRGFQDMAIQDWANGQARDAAEAASFARQQDWASGKVGIYGYSYGGIISLAVIARVPGAFDAAVPMGGIYDFADAHETADRLGQLFTREGHGGTPDEQPGAYAVSDSVARLGNVETPVLLMHGEADVRAPFRQFEMVVEELERHGKVFESHSYPDEPHRFSNPENRVDMYRRLEAWMDRWLLP